MPTYEFRCKACQHEFELVYKTTAAYAAATPTCPNCGATTLSRVIRRVAIEAPSRDFTRMSASEMLSVFSSGDSKQVGQMFDQVAGTHPGLAVEYHEATKRLLKGEPMDKVEKHLQERDAEKKPPSSPPPPAAPSS
ncbi:zinc ribbon domain-containing protein [Aggregatilineales bacterium SYSU G02658]